MFSVQGTLLWEGLISLQRCSWCIQPTELKPFYNRNDNIYKFKGNIIIVPTDLRGEVRNLSHSRHLGIEKCIARARQHVYWPGIIAEIKDTFSNCNIILDERNQQSSEPIIPHEILETPWTKIGSDIFELHQKTQCDRCWLYQVFLTFTFTEKQSLFVITHLKSMFIKFGVPRTVICDNGPDFKVIELKHLLRNGVSNLTHQVFSITNPIVFSHTVRRTLKKTMNSNQEP